MSRLANRASLDLVSTSAATIFNTANLTTTPVQYPNATTGYIRKIVVTNRHATNYVTIGISPTTTSPTFTASAAGAIGATEGIAVLPLSQYFVNLTSNLAIWVVASAGSTPVQIAAYDTVAQ